MSTAIVLLSGRGLTLPLLATAPDEAHIPGTRGLFNYRHWWIFAVSKITSWSHTLLAIAPDEADILGTRGLFN